MSGSKEMIMSEYTIALIGLMISIIGVIMSVILFWQIMINGRRDKINQNQFNDLKKYVYKFFKKELKRVFKNNPEYYKSFMESINDTFNTDFNGEYNKYIALAYLRSGLNPNISTNDSNWFHNKKNKELLLRFSILNYIDFVTSRIEPYRVELGGPDKAHNYAYNQVYAYYGIKPTIIFNNTFNM